MRVIELEPADNVASAFDRLLQAGERRVVLVLPHGGVLRSPVDLARLRRLADRERLEVGLVVEDRETARLARAMGLPVFKGVGAAERRRRWRPPRRRQRLGFPPGADRRPPGPAALTGAAQTGKRRRALLALALSATTLLLMAVFAVALTIPRAEIVLRPVARPVQVARQLTADPTVRQVDMASDAIPARTLSMTQDWEAEIEAGGDEAAARARLRAQALQSLQAAAPDLLAVLVGDQEALVPASARLVGIVEERYSLRGDNRLILNLRAELQAAAIPLPDLHWYLYQELAALAPPDSEVVVESLKTDYVLLTGPDAAGRTLITVTGRAQAINQPNLETAHAAVAGRRQGEAADALREALSLQEQSDIVLRPPWWARLVGRVPWRLQQIEFRLEPGPDGVRLPGG